ncbi:MAG: nicotinamide mononucleotide transporter, partial [Alphaproteobacteria bacterium]
MFLFFEVTAVTFAIAYLFLAMRQSIACWYAAFLSTLIYTIIYWDVALYMESLLNIYYLFMAVYGWINWN